MKKVFATLMIMLLTVTGMAQVKMLKPYLSTTIYDVPGLTPYVENALAVDCRSAVYKEFEPGKFKATVEITTIFKHDDKVCNFSKIALDSPVVTDTTNLDGAFIDQQRFSLPNGEYKMEISVVDLNAKDQIPSHDVMTVSVDFPDGTPAVSDILFFDSYTKAAQPSSCTKSGMDFLPRVYPFFGASDAKLKFYAELYNSDKLYDEGKFLVSYYIESSESSSVMRDFTFSKRFDVNKVNIVMNTLDVSDLPSGNYYLVVEMRDRNNELVCSNSAFFQRSNPGVGYHIDDIAGVDVSNTFVSGFTDIDTLRLFISYLDPICSETERNYSTSLVKTGDMKTMQQFMFNFWSTRAPLNPGQAWKDYLGAVKRVNMSFKTTSTPGYRTDRGYVFLKYGQPDKIVESPNEPNAYPYAIWHYYAVANQRNKRFVFMSKDESTNDYHLIHSDVVGEVNNYRWQMEIYSRVYGVGYDQGLDQTKYENMWGSHADDLYNNPR
ncbi:MAG: GWxTD domain-containing protein [Bacteroidales bacterium]|nr:GWxTD domain-containing protein [Bacteroidales bacterium]